MGDTGSNLLGYLLAIVAVQVRQGDAVVALFLPLLVLAVPILDSTTVIAKRLKYRQPIYVGDRSHFNTTGWRTSGSRSGGRSPTSTGEPDHGRACACAALRPTATTTATSTSYGQP